MKARSHAVRALLIVAAAMIGSCGKEKTTALDLRLEVTDAIDQVRIDAVTLGGASVVLGPDEKLFPASPRTLKTGDVLTLWFADSADMQAVSVTATGRLCGKDATAQVMTAPRPLSRSATVTATLTLTNNGTTCTSDGGAGSGGGGGRDGGGRDGGGGGGGGGGDGGGGAGTGGASGAGGTGGVSATGGSAGGGSAGRGGTGVAGSAGGAGRGGAGGTAAGGAGGIAGTGGAAGRGGTGGSAGTGGAAGRGGTGGTTGAGGSAGRGGTTGTGGGTAGTGGGAGRGGTTGTAGIGGAAGRGGTGGGGGTGGARSCATGPLDALAQPLGTAFSTPTSCGYPSMAPQGLEYVWTGGQMFALVSTAVYGNSANCGRCVELVRSSSTAPPRRATVTIVGSCNDQVCAAIPGPRFQLSQAAYDMLGSPLEAPLPPADEILTYSFVPCLVPAAPNGQPERIRASFLASGGERIAVLFVGQGFGISSATAALPGGTQNAMTRGNDNYWRPPLGMTFGAQSASFVLTDTNNKSVSFDLVLPSPGAFVETTAQFPTCQ